MTIDIEILTGRDCPLCREAEELVEEGVDGLWFQPRDAMQLADEIKKLFNNSELRAKMGKAGRARAERRFTPSVHREQLVALYEQLLARE